MKTKKRFHKKSPQRLSPGRPLSLKDQGFQKRKEDHIKITLDSRSQFVGQNPLEKIQLQHTAFPELDWKDLSIESQFQDVTLGAPFFISSMTAGHAQGKNINLALAEFSSEKKILMGVGSQRKELTEDRAKKEWSELRKSFPKALLISNIGLSQLIETPIDKILEIIDNLKALGIFIHVNPLQECIQKEGTPQFRGGLKAIENLVKKSPVPVIVKEVGNGFSLSDRKRLQETGIYALDLSAKGGTDWARVEALRYVLKDQERASGLLYSHWGYDLIEMLNPQEKINVSYQIWGSGGIRTGLDVAKCIAMGCEKVGLAQPWLKALIGQENLTAKKDFKVNPKALFSFYEQLEKELKIALFCTGSKSPKELSGKWVLKG